MIRYVYWRNKTNGNKKKVPGLYREEKIDALFVGFINSANFT